MEEADKVSSSSGPDEAIMNEAGQTRDAEEERTEKTSSPQTTEVTSASQSTEVTSASQSTEVTSSPQVIEETSASLITEETSSPQPAEVIVTEIAEESVTPVMLSEVPVKQTSTEAEVTSTSQTYPVITEAAVTPHVTEAVTNAEERVTPSVTEAAEERVTPCLTEAVPPEVTSSQQTVMREERVTPVKSAESPAPEISSSSAAHTHSAHTHSLSSEAREEEEKEKHPHTLHPSSSNDPEPPAPGVAPALFQTQFPSVLQLLRWRDVRLSALVFGSSLFVLLFLTCYSIISILSYAALLLLSGTVSFRVYRGVLQAVQKSDEGHPFRCVLEKDLALSREAVERHSDDVLSRINGTLKELRRLFLVEDLVDSLKFGVLLWVFTYVGSWFNGLTLLILGLVGAFSGPITYEKHQTQIDQFISSVSGQMKGVLGKIQEKVPGAKKKPE